MWVDFEATKSDDKGLNEGTNLGRFLQQFATAVQKKLKKQNDDMLEFDDPYNGFAMFSLVLPEDARVQK